MAKSLSSPSKSIPLPVLGMGDITQRFFTGLCDGKQGKEI
jgi:hypothetical protein